MTKTSRLNYAFQTQLKAIPILSIFLANSISLEFGSWQLPLYPFIGLAFYFHWMIYRPDCLPPIALGLTIFASSAWISDSPSFILPLIYLGLYPLFLTYRHRLFGQKFSKIWAAFGAYSFLVMTLYWASKALIEKEYFSYSTLFISSTLIGLAYPLLTLLNSSLQRLIPLR